MRISRRSLIGGTAIFATASYSGWKLWTQRDFVEPLDPFAKHAKFLGGSVGRRIGWEENWILSGGLEFTFNPIGSSFFVRGVSRPAIYNLKTGKITPQFVGGPPSPGLSNCVAFSSNGSLLASGDLIAGTRMSNVRNGEFIRAYNKQDGETKSVSFSPDNQQMVSGARDTHIWDPNTGKTLQIIPSSSAHVFYSPDGSKLFTKDSFGPLKVWDSASGAPLGEIGKAFGQIILSSKRDLLFAISWPSDSEAPGQLEFWDVASLSRIATNTAPRRYGLEHVAFAEKGSRLLTSGDGITRIWDAKTGEQISEIESELISAAALSPDGQIAALTSGYRVVELFDTKNGNPIARLHGHQNKRRIYAISSAFYMGRVGYMKFTPSGTQLITADAEEMLIWDLNFEN